MSAPQQEAVLVLHSLVEPLASAPQGICYVKSSAVAVALALCLIKAGYSLQYAGKNYVEKCAVSRKVFIFSNSVNLE
jgi:hypothetical protein